MRFPLGVAAADVEPVVSDLLLSVRQLNAELVQRNLLPRDRAELEREKSGEALFADMFSVALGMTSLSDIAIRPISGVSDAEGDGVCVGGGDYELLLTRDKQHGLPSVSMYRIVQGSPELPPLSVGSVHIRDGCADAAATRVAPYVEGVGSALLTGIPAAHVERLAQLVESMVGDASLPTG